MGERSFKEYIENRTIEDIMEDYGEQRDEWETLIESQDGNVVRFKHSNGRTYFCTQCTSCDDVIFDLVKNNEDKTIERQMKNFCVIEISGSSETAHGDITKEQLKENAISLSEYDGVVELILKGDLLLGAVVKGCFGNADLLIGQSVCTCSASDNDGGCKDSKKYVYLAYTNYEGQIK